MARDWSAEGNTTAGGSPFDAAPAGLQQQRTKTDWSQGQAGSSPWLRPAWQTGGQVGSTRNAFNDDFFTRMYDQYDEEQKKTQADPNYVSNLFGRKDFTGIVGWDQDIKKNDPVLGASVAQDRSFRVGDVYDNGKKLGNVYDTNSGLSITEANAMVAPHIFGDKAADKYKEAGGDQQKLKSLILEQGKEQGKNVQAYATRQPYQQSVDNLLEEWNQNPGFDIANVAAGAAGGAAVGRVGGVWGMVAGGVLGAIGSFLNRDEAAQQAASAAVSTGLMAQREGLDAAVGQGLQSFGAFAGSKLNIFSNLVAGGVDTFSGNRGDNKSEFQRATSEGNVGAMIAQGITGLADGALTTATPVGRAAYMATMGMNVGGSAYNKISRQGEWDEVTGSFHRYENAGQALAAAGSSFIDVGQMALVPLLGRSNKLGMGGKSHVDPSLLKEGESTVTHVMDRAFNVTNQGGKIVATSEDKMQSFLGWLAPSTATNRLSVQIAAYKGALNRGESMVSANDLYQAATKIEQASVPWKLAMINGFGEAAEEVSQTFLNGQATGWAAQQNDYVQAALQGFAMGAGMSFGTRLGNVSQDRRMLDRTNVMRQLAGQPRIEKSEWAKMDRTDKVQASTPSKSIQQLIAVANQNSRADMTNVVVRGTTALTARDDAIKDMSKTSPADLPGDGVEMMSEITHFNDISIPEYHVLHSAQTTVERLNERLQGLKERIAAEVDPNAPELDKAHLQQVHDELQRIVDTQIKPLHDDYLESGNENALHAINTILQDSWNGTPQQREAVELIFTRSPNDNPGSFQMLLPQIDLGYTRNGVDGIAKVSQSLEKMLSFDTDGDKIKHKARAVTDARSRAALRLGLADFTVMTNQTADAPFGGSRFLNMTEREYETPTLENMQRVLASNDVVEKQALDQAVQNLANQLRSGLGNSLPDSVIEIFQKNLLENPTGAKAEFYRAAAQYSGALIERGAQGSAEFPPETRIGLWIEGVVQRHLESWRDGSALRIQVSVHPTTKSSVKPNALASDLQSTTPLAARTVGQSMEQRLGAGSSFRSYSSLGYNFLNSVEESAQGAKEPDAIRQALMDLYTIQSRLRLQDQVTTVRRGGNDVVREARADLERLAKVFFDQNSGLTAGEQLARLSNMPVWNISQNQLESEGYDLSKHMDVNTTIGQLLLKNAAERIGDLTPPTPGELSPTIAYGSIQRAQAVRLLLGDLNPADLMTQESLNYLGGMVNLDLSIRYYTQMVGRDDRKQWRDSVKASPEYHDTESMFRWYADTVMEASDKELAHGDRATGHAVGRLAEEDRAFHKDQVIKAFESIHQIVRKIGVSGKNQTEVLNALEKDTRVFQIVLGMFPAEMRATMILSAEDNNVDSAVIPQFVLDMITETSAEKAAMIYFNAMFQMEYVNRNQDSAPSNSWIALYQSLDQAGKDLFDDMRESATSVQAFVDQVNRDLSYNTQPMLAWRTDTSMFDPASTRAGWQWSAPSAERRQAIQNATKYLVNKADVIGGELKLRAQNKQYASKLLKDLQDPRRTVRGNAQRNVTAFLNRVTQGQIFSQIAMGPSATREFLRFAYRGFESKSVNKGIANDAIAQFGDGDIRKNRTGFGTMLSQALNADLVNDTVDITFNPQMMTRPMRFQTPTGLTINWDPTTPDFAQRLLEFFVADDGAYQGMLWDMINPTVYEENSLGRAVQQYVLPKSLKQIVEGNFYNEILLGEGSRDSQQNDELLLSFVNSLTPENNLTRFQAHVAITRTLGENAGSDLGNGMYNRLTSDVAKLVRVMASMTEADLDEAREQYRSSVVADWLKRTGRSDVAGITDLAEFRKVVEAARIEMETIEARYKALPTDAVNVELIDATQRYAQLSALFDSKSMGEVMLTGFDIKWGTAAELVTRSMIRDYIRIFGPDIQTSSRGKDATLLSQYANAPVVNDFKVFGNEATNKKAWDQLARVVAAHNALRSNGLRSAAFFASPETKEIKYFDPTYSYLVQEFLDRDSGIYKAAQTLRQSAGASTALPDSSAATFLQILKQTILDPTLLGDWDPSIVAAHLNAENYLGQSGAPQQVAVGGMVAQQQIAASKSAKRSTSEPDLGLARPYSIDARQFIESRNNPYDKGLNGDPWALLNGAAVVATEGNAPALVIRDENGLELERIPLYVEQHSAVTRSENIKGVAHGTLVDNVALRMQGRPASTRATVEFSMFHPADKPAEAEWANNIFFDGSLGATDAADDIYSAFLIGPQGLGQQMQRAALDSIKGSVAIFSQRVDKKFDDKAAGALNDTVNDIVRDVMNTQILENEYLDPGVYRSIYRQVRDRLAIKSGDQILSSEQVMTGAELDAEAEVIELSVRGLETLRGSTSGSGHPLPMERAPLPGGEADLWTGVFTPVALSRMPDLGKHAVGVSEIGEALRSSGMLSNERVDQFTYKDYTANERKIRATPYSQFKELRASIKESRRRSENYEHLQQTTNKVLNYAVDKLQSMGNIDDMTVNLLKERLGDPSSNSYIEEVSATTDIAGLQIFLKTMGGRAFLLDPRRQSQTASEGYLSSLRETSGPAADRVSPVDDVIVFDLDGFEGLPGTGEWSAHVRDELMLARERGLTVVLLSNDKKAQYDAGSYMMEGNIAYERSTIGTPIYFSKNTLGLHKTKAAAAASLSEGTVHPLLNNSLIMADELGNIMAGGEGVLLDPRSDWMGIGTTFSSNIVPTNGFARYGAPGTPEAGQRAQVVLTDMLDNLDYLAEQALLGSNQAVSPKAIEKKVAELEPLVRKALTTLNPLTGLPKEGANFVQGDLILSFTGDLGAVQLSRWGYETKQFNSQAQDENGLDDSRPGLTAADSVRFYGETKLKSTTASVHGGTIDSWVIDPVFGWRAIFKNDLTLEGAKMIWQGRKSRGSEMPVERRPNVPLLGKLFPGAYDNMGAIQKKGMLQHAAVNARQAIALWGWDANRSLANALNIFQGHPEGEQAMTWSVQDWSAASAQTRASVTALVRNQLEMYRIGLKNEDRTNDPVALAAQIMGNDQVTDLARKIIEENSGMSFAAVQAKAQKAAVQQSGFDVEAQYLGAVLDFLKGDGHYVSQVLGAPGFDQEIGVENRETYEMPSMLTEFIDANPALRQYVQQDINSRMEHNQYDDANRLVEGWWIREDWRVVQKNKDGAARVFVPIWGRVDPTGTDDVESAVENNRSSTQDTASNQAQTLAYLGTGLDVGDAVRDQRLTDVLQDLKARGFERYQWSRGFGGARATDGQTVSVEEQKYRSDSLYRAEGYAQLIDQSRFSETPADLDRMNRGYQAVYQMLGFTDNGTYRRHVDTMVRILNRAWHDPRNPGPDELSALDVAETLDIILDSLKNYRWPTIDGLMPVVHADVAAAIADAGKWTPDNAVVTGDRRNFMLTSALHSLFYAKTQLPPDSATELNGLLRSYDRYLDAGYWLPSVYTDEMKMLIDPRSGEFVSSIDPLTQRSLEIGNPYKDAGIDTTMANGAAVTTGATKSEMSRRRRAAAEKGRATRGTSTMTAAEMARNGRELMDEVRVSTQMWRNLHALRTIVPQLNPLLWIWNPADMQMRRMPAAAGSLLSGSSTGFFGRQMRDRVQWLSENLRNEAVIDTLGVQGPYIDEEANLLLPQIIKELSHSIKFRTDIAQETVHRPDDLLLTAGDRRRQKAVDWASKMQDISHGMLKPQEARMYIEGVLEHERMMNPNVTALQVLMRLHENPLYFKEQASDPGAHKQAIARIQNVKGAKQTSIGIAIDNVLIPWSKSPNGLLHAAGNTILLLTKFRNFAISSGIALTGAQGLDAAASVFMQARAFKKAQDTGSAPVDILSKTLESVDIADTFIKSGLSHTGLFMAAMAFNALGLTGEDEEDRRRKRIQQLQGLGVLYDPRDIANDFRNRDAIFLDKIPLLNVLYETPAGEDQPRRSPAQLHWTLNFFVAPVLGLSEFMQTGDFYDLVHGYESAIGSMPLINTNFFWDAVDTSSTLYNESVGATDADPGELTVGMKFLFNTVGVLEKSLIESAFINELVSAQDEYARNPWGLPEVDAAGNIQRDRAGVPEQTEATERRLGPDGTYIDARETRSYEEGLIRAFTSNNQTAAFLATLFTGNFGKRDSFMRGDMAVTQRTMQKAGINNGDAEALIMSFYDQTGKEILSPNGAERLVDSLHSGTIKPSDPAFQNIFLTFDQRKQISESLQKKIFIEGVQTLGLSEDDAKKRMWDIWYGPKGQPNVTPLSDVVWSRGKYADENGIPWSQTTTYRQLNTTWATGPDGKPWATGVDRAAILRNGRLPLIDPYTGSKASMRGNLGVDELLNSTDEAAQLNTGMRGLTRVDQSQKIPGDQEIIDAIKKSTDNVLDAIKDMNSDLYSKGNPYGGGYRYGGGGGGGGGGSSYSNNPVMPFLNAMRSENTDNIPQMYINTINVRRADIRRERFSAERGRLNQWQ